MIFNDKKFAISYEIIGEGQPVLLLHGLSCDRNLMKGCMEPIFTKIKGFQRIYVDLPGMGASKAATEFASSDEILASLVAFVKEVIQEDFLLVGESYGGYLASGILSELQNKVKKMLLICPCVEPDHEKRRLPEKDFVDYDDEFLATLTSGERASFCHYGIVANQVTYGRYLEEVLSGVKVADGDFLKELAQHYAYTFDLKHKLSSFDCQTETFIMAGKQDVCVGYEDLYEFSQCLPRSSFILVDKGGHNLQIDRPKIFNQMVIGWLGVSDFI